ncbi:septum site-determining protein MinC [Macromonas bipunctata]|uniref:septum site-determining protein MinC n=1 Tax=Macromonas bipunctata TaxID=183670 RepID=UPI000C323974|nr:septum site-determining protein MinC [Macromonas bipunctata]
MSLVSGNSPSSYDIKSAQLSVVVLLLKSNVLSVLDAELEQRFGRQSLFFSQDPVLLDLSPLAAQACTVDYAGLLALLQGYGMVVVAVKGGSPEQMQAALQFGLAQADDQLALQPSTATRHPQHPPSGPDIPAPLDAGAVYAETVPALVVDKPLRSGQQVYARGRDLLVMAMVNPGAEVIADGHIHVYAPLRGRAMAGARGWTEARIFAQVMEPELVSIAGIYRTSEVPLPADVLGKPAQVRLQVGPEGDQLRVDPIP